MMRATDHELMVEAVTKLQRTLFTAVVMHAALVFGGELDAEEIVRTADLMIDELDKDG